MIKKVGNAKEFGNFDLIERRKKDLYIQKGKGKNNMQFSQLQKMHINQMTSWFYKRWEDNHFRLDVEVVI